MGLKQAAESSLQPHGEVAPALRRELPTSVAWEFRNLAARRKKPTIDVLRQLIDFRDGIQNQCALEFRRAARPEERNQSRLSAARDGCPRKDRNR
jgi:hypothetical protein